MESSECGAAERASCADSRAAFPSSERWDVAGLQGRVSPLPVDGKAASGSLTSSKWLAGSFEFKSELISHQNFAK